MPVYLYPSATTWPGTSTYPGELPLTLAQVHAAARAERAARKARRSRPAWIRLWDGNIVLRGHVRDWDKASFQRLDNEPGVGTLSLCRDYYLGKWAAEHEDRDTDNIHISVDKDGTRWFGRAVDIESDDDTNTVTITFKHDIAELEHFRLWANPFLLAEVQFPKFWMLAGPTRWAMKLALLVNIMRKESSIWMLPDDPLDPTQWFNFDQSTWTHAVVPHRIQDDNSPQGVSLSRFKSALEAFKRPLQDGQMSLVPRRYLDGDPPPWPGANLRHGCLVWDIVDKSGWLTETSFGGNLATGLTRSFTNIASDGLTEGIDAVPDPNTPAEYTRPGWMGTLPVAPWAILRTGIGVTGAKFKWRPATDVQIVTGGHSMPGTNEMMALGIIMAGDLTAMIPGVPPVGGAAEAVLRPIYEDTLFAFQVWKDVSRAAQLGDFHYFEHWADGSDRAYTLAALITLRTGLWQTGKQISHSVTISDAAPYLIGATGHGHLDIGDRVGVTVPGSRSGRVYVDRISELTLTMARGEPTAWVAQVGARDFRDPVIAAWEEIKEITSMAQQLGVL